MKYLLRSLALIALLTVTYTAQAQITIGLRGGYQSANVNLTDGLDRLAPETKAINAFSIAAVADVPLGYGFSIQPELAYNQKGFRMEEGFDVNLFDIPIPIDVEAESRFNYLEVPLLFKYKFGAGKVNAYINGGPALGYALNGNLTTYANALVDIKLLETDIDLDAINYERVEFSAIVGGGITIDAGVVQLFADARYQHGFTELYDIPVVEETIKNKSFGVNAGFLIPIGGSATN